MTSTPDTLPPEHDMGCVAQGARALMAVVLVVLGTAFVTGGIGDIRSRTHTTTWRSGSSVGVGPIGVTGGQSSGVERVDGTDAVLMGVGFVAFGAMFIGWAAVCVTAIFGTAWRRLPEGRRFRTAVSLCAVLATLQLVGLLGTFPPWRWAERPSSVGLWASLLVLAATGAGIAMRWWPPSVGGWATLGSLVWAVASGTWLGPSAGTGAFVSLFAAILLFMHGWPIWSRRIRVESAGTAPAATP
ncbi:MAG TPA: hypothetical protein VF796_12500 [Humisphaera sp.]